VSGGFELRPDVRMVVDLAVEDDPDRLVLVRQRLMAGRQIDDAQPAVAERRLIVHEQSRIVWAAMRDDVAHRDDARAVVSVQPTCPYDSRDPAHAPEPFTREPTPRPAPIRRGSQRLP
jgi:hypothetical protein